MLQKLKVNAKNWVTGHEKRVSNASEGVRKLTMCKKCFTFYYKNSWHFEKPEYLNQDGEEDIPVRFTQCPACLEEEVSAYETLPELAWRRG